MVEFGYVMVQTVKSELLMVSGGSWWSKTVCDGLKSVFGGLSRPPDGWSWMVAGQVLMMSSGGPPVQTGCWTVSSGADGL